MANVFFDVLGTLLADDEAARPRSRAHLWPVLGRDGDSGGQVFRADGGVPGDDGDTALRILRPPPGAMRLTRSAGRLGFSRVRRCRGERRRGGPGAWNPPGAS